MPLGIWTRVQSLFFGTAIGAAASEAISPQLEPAKQEAWKANQAKILDPGTLAEAVATGGITLAQAEAEAQRSGLNVSRLHTLVYLALEAPDVSEALRMRRRNLLDPALGITDAQLEHALAKAGIEQSYWPALKQLTDEPLSPAIVAEAIQRGIMADPGFLPVAPPTGVGNVPAFPVSDLDPLREAEASGVSRERLFVETALIGNPVGPDTAARAFYRGLLTSDDFGRAIAEGRTRNEWGPTYLEVGREILTTTQAVNLRLRGWTDDQGMFERSAKHGMSEADTRDLFLIQGRPLSWHQTFIGIQRGGKYGGDPLPVDPEFPDIEPAFLKALKESDIRPEWYPLAWAQRYNYPTAFVLRSLTTDGDITQAQAEQILTFEGWDPSLAKQVSEKWAGGGGASVPAEVKSARTKLLTTLHKSYVQNGADVGPVIASLQAVPYPQELIDALLEVWDNERGYLASLNANPPSGGVQT